MYLDAQDSYTYASGSNYQSLVQGTGTYYSTNVVDHVGFGDDYNQPWLNISIGTAFVGAGATLAINLLTDYNATFTGAPVTIPLGTFTMAQLQTAGTAGTPLVKLQYPQGMHEFREIQYVITGAAITAGTLNCYDTIDVATNLDKLGYSSGAGINQ